MKIRSFLTFLFMFMLSLTGHSQNIDTDAVYELHIADGLVLDNQGSFGNGARVFIARRVEARRARRGNLSRCRIMSTTS